MQNTEVAVRPFCGESDDADDADDGQFRHVTYPYPNPYPNKFPLTDPN